MAHSESFDKMYTHFVPLLKQLAHRYSFIAGFEEAYAVATFAMYEAYLNFDASKGSFPAYVKCYVRGKLLHFVRKELHYRKFHVLSNPREEDESWEENIPNEQESKPFEISEELSNAMNRLNARERMAIFHYYVLDRPLTELAQKEGVSHSTVCTWKRRGIEKLKKWIER